MGMTSARGYLTGYTLKWIAILAMLVDHIAWGFVPFGSLLGQGMHMIGRMTVPIMAFFIAQGYVHTRSVPRYALRLLAFALLSQLPFALFFSPRGGPVDFFHFNVLFTLLLGLVCLWIWDRQWSQDRLVDRVIKGAALLIGCYLGMYCDWAFAGVLFVFIFGRFRHRFAWQVFGFAGVVVLLFGYWIFWRKAPLVPQLFQLGLFLPLPLLGLYNGQRGKDRRWLFYVFYPVHLWLLWLVGLLLYPS